MRASSAGASSALVAYLSNLIKEALATELVASALFLAERLHAILPAEEASAFLLALCLLRAGNPQGAIYVLRNLVHHHGIASGDQPSSSSAGAHRGLYDAGQANKYSQKQRNNMVTSPGNWRSASAANMGPANASSLRCALVYAKACCAVGRNREAEHVLTQAVSKFGKQQTDRESDLLTPSNANTSKVTLYLHSAVASLRSQRHEEAAAHYTQALQECWYCWEAFEGLCYIGQAPDPISTFGPPNAPLASISAAPLVPKPMISRIPTSTSTSSLASTTPSMFSSTNQSFDSSSSFETSILTSHPPQGRLPSSAVGLGTALATSGLFTPPTSHTASSSIFNGNLHMPAAPVPMRKNSSHGANPGKEAVRRSTRLTGNSNAAPATSMPSSNPALFLNSLHNTNTERNLAKGKEPRSRVLSNPRERKRAKASPPPANNPTHSAGTAMPVFKAHSPMPSNNNASGPAMPKNPEDWLRTIFVKFAKAERHLSRFEATQAIETLMTLEVEQRRSWRASIGVGRARMETLDYAAAEKAFAAARESAPYQIAHSDLHSTLLWHLNRNTDLSYLAQQIMGLAPLSVEAWICTGNVFSLIDDHANALKCFKRAIQIVEGDGLSLGNGLMDPSSMSVLRAGSVATSEYPYVLAGHECVAMEEWENALTFFRHAVTRRRRSYTPWFGIGNVYMNTGKLRLAEFHFQKAAEINPSNAMLVSRVGTIYEKLGKRQEALDAFERACVLAPTSAAVRFKTAKLLLRLGRFPAALKELLSLAALAPDEFHVQYLLGKVYGKMGQRQQMTKHFTFAQDLNPKQAQRIRDAIEEIDDKKSAVEEDEDMSRSP